MKVKCTQRYGCEWTGMCRHMQRVSLTDRRLTPSRIVRNDVAQWEHVFIPLWSPYITHLGKWIGLTLYMWQFHPAFNTQVTEGKKIQQRFYILIWSVNCSWDMEDEIIFIGRPVWDMDRFFLMSLSIQSFEKCISKGLHKIFCMFLSAINLNVKGYFKCSLESHWSTGKKTPIHSFFHRKFFFNLNQDINTSDLISAWLLFYHERINLWNNQETVFIYLRYWHTMKSDTPGFLKLDIYTKWWRL